MFNCKYCGKECKNKNSLIQHEIRCKQNPNKLDLSYLDEIRKKAIVSNHKGENQYTKAKRNNYTVVISDELRKKFGDIWRGKHLPDEMKAKISEGMKKAVQKYPNSYSSSNVNGRVKHYEYNGIILDGKWEVKVAKYLDKLNIEWLKPSSGFKYIWNNEEHMYFPDFYLPTYDIYIEVKGYERERDLYKWKSLDNLIVIKKKEINKIINNEYNIKVIIDELKNNTSLA